MPLALETILAVTASAAGGGFSNLSPGVGDTFNVRSFEDGSHAVIEEIWGLDVDNPAQLSIKSPRMHDQTRGILLAIPSGAATGANPEEPHLLMGPYMTQEVYQSDSLTVSASATAADGIVAAFTVRYDNLGGSKARLYSWDTIKPLIVNLVGILVQPTNGTAAYGTPVTLDSVDDRLKADTDYALLGAVTSVPTALISVFGADTANYRIGLPGFTEPVSGSDWFVQLDRKYGTPHIPVINANNKGNTQIVTCDVETGATPNVTLIFAQLAAKLPA